MIDENIKVIEKFIKRCKSYKNCGEGDICKFCRALDNGSLLTLSDEDIKDIAKDIEESNNVIDENVRVIRVF